MKKPLVCLIFCLLTCSLYCQYTARARIRRDKIKNIRKNSINVEILGNAPYSISYERLFPVTINTGLGLRIGCFYWGFLDDEYAIPLELNSIFSKRHCLELGTGVTLGVFADTGTTTFISFRAGYRYRADSGFLCRIAPMILYKENEWKPRAGLTLGYSW
jgi:hypothetical protein